MYGAEIGKGDPVSPKGASVCANGASVYGARDDTGAWDGIIVATSGQKFD